MNKSGLQKLFVCVLLFWLTGCAENKYTETMDKVCVSAKTKTDAMAAAERVLGEMHFAIEKLDVETGCIRTLPLSGAQSFEFWRADNVGSFNRAEADLHSIQRIVELNITEQAGQLCTNCKATTLKLSSPQNQATASQGHAIMSPDQKSLQKLGPEQKSNITWIDLGRDNQLETEILKRIEKQLNTTGSQRKK